MTLAEELFNILKGANLKLRLFDTNGQKTLDEDQAARLYAYEDDMLVTIRMNEDNSAEVVVQVGTDFSYEEHKKMLEQIKQVAHNHMSEYNIRKFSKQIAPKDFAHDVVAEGYSKAHGTIKTSYISLPEARLVIKHSKGVNEEIRGARSRNIKSLFIENAAGERFAFPHRYLQGAKAMAKHVSMGGTPYDAIGESILNTCKDIVECNQFLRHVRTNKLVNEGNENVVEAVRSKLQEMKNTIRSLQTSKGYNEYEVSAIVEDDKQVDVANKFLYNTFENANMDAVLTTVARIIKERESMADLHKEKVVGLYKMIQSGADFKMNIDANDPEHPDNEDQSKYRGPQGQMAKLSAMLTFLSYATKNDEAFNYLSHLAENLFELPNEFIGPVNKMANFLINQAGKPKAEAVGENIVETAIATLRRKIS